MMRIFVRIGWKEVGFRILLLLMFFYTETMAPFERVVQKDKYLNHMFPTTPSIVPSPMLYAILAFSCTFVLGVSFILSKDSKRIVASLCVLSLTIPINGIITNIIKVTFGRLRPDYFNRCYGENYLDVKDIKLPCVGDSIIVLDGRKSFPSGHSSLSFSVFGFLGLYLLSQLGTYTSRNRYQSWRLVMPMLPFILATLIAISRTCDYHHHVEDILAGSLLGFLIVFASYRIYFPAIDDPRCEHPFPLSDEADELDARLCSYIDRETRLNNYNITVKTI